MYVYNHKKNNSLSYLGGTTLHYAIIVKCPIPPFDPHLPLGLVDNARFWIVSLENVYVRQPFFLLSCMPFTILLLYTTTTTTITMHMY